MQINAKVGTCGSTVLRVKYKQRSPRQGERIWVKELDPGSKWFQVRVDKVDSELRFYHVSLV